MPTTNIPGQNGTDEPQTPQGDLPEALADASPPVKRDYVAEGMAAQSAHIARQATSWRAAVAAATAAYAKTGRMLDAALAYARHGIPVFPVTVDKIPVPPRDRDVNGRSIPGTGSFKKATTNEAQIRAWWRRQEHLISVPMGYAAGVVCIDVDTSEDHADGVAQWHKLIAQHEPIITREHRSATGGPHLIFTFNWGIGCSSGDLPEGIDVKGEGGYIVVPPSRRKERDYTVHVDIDPAPMPKWLSDLIGTGRRREPFRGQVTADAEEVADALAAIPNVATGWDDWKIMGLRIYASLGDSGFDLFDAWSTKSHKYTEEGTAEAWEQIEASPPDRTGVGAIFKIARKHGWTPRLFECEPTYAAAAGDVDAARRRVRTLIDEFWERADAYHAQLEGLTKEQREELPPPVEAMCVETGVGKTEQTIATVAAGAKSGLVYMVDRHKLSDKIEERLAAVGVTAAVFRGRSADDPENPGEQMCLEPERVRLAMKTHADISETCCVQRKRGRACPLLSRCGYWRQQGVQPDVWITSHDMLFHVQKAFGKPLAVIVDEGMWDKGIRGIGDEETEWTVPLDSLITDPGNATLDDAASMRAHHRNRLARALMKQDHNGSVEREHLDTALSVYVCGEARRVEWHLMPTLGQHPGMSDFEIKTLACNSETIDAIQHSRRVIQIWEAVGELLRNPDVTVSGRLTLKQSNGQRVVEWRGVAKITKQFQVPTLLLDATLPALPLLRVYHRQVETVADIKVAMPEPVRIRQVLRAPTSSNKLNDEKHLDNVQRTILQRWIETGRGPSLVICQQKVEEYLRRCGLPTAIELAHYNDIAGLDDFKAVRLCMLIGRTAPGPRAMEALAAALSGRQPVLMEAERGDFVWYNRVPRGIRLRDGRGIKTYGDQHRDPFVEAIRWQVHEGELVQALGRPRGVNRTAAAPLDIDLLFDTCLPITVDEAVLWAAPSLLYATAAEGVMLTAPVDMTRLWPALWPNSRAADRTLAEGVPVVPGFEEVAYQLAGAKMKRRLAHFDRTVIGDPEAWLRDRLGPLA